MRTMRLFILFCISTSLLACKKVVNDEELSSLFVKEVSVDSKTLLPFDAATVKVTYVEKIALQDKSKIQFDGGHFEVKDSVSSLIFNFRNLQPNTKYNINILKGAVISPVTKITSNDYSFSFTTMKEYMSVISNSFSDIYSVSYDKPRMIVQFSEQVKIVDKSKIEIECRTSSPFFVANDSLDCVIVQFDNLEPDTDYTIKIKEGSVKAVGKDDVFSEDYSYRFITQMDGVDMENQIKPDYSPDVPNPTVPAKGNLMFNIDPQPANPNATPEARKLYQYLKDNFGKNTLSGCFEEMNWNITTERSEWYKDSIGVYPAIFGYDFMNSTRDNWGDSYEVFVKNATDCWRRGGIVSCMWHWRDPSHGTDSFRPVYHEGGADFDIKKIYDPSSEEYNQMIKDIDIVAGWFKKLQENGVPVLWRPLHEAEGTYKNTGWFWWGAGEGPDRERSAACMELWRVMYNRMVHYHGLNNLLWVWTSHVEGGGTYEYPWFSDGRRWYPGHNTVDIIGLDIYEKKHEHMNQYQAFARTAMVADMRKMVALTECGFVPTVETMEEEGCMWAYFMPWNGDFTTDNEYNGVEYLKKVYSYDKVITIDDSTLSE